MKKIWRYLGQGLIYLLFITFIGYFSSSPGYTNMPADKALIKFTLTHPGKRVTPFHDTRTKQDLAKLSPQLRYAHHSRNRSPLKIKLVMDGMVVYQAKIQARGLSHDLPSPVYQRFTVPAGEHHFRVFMGDDIHYKGFNYTAEKTIKLTPLKVLIIDFNNIRKEFVFE